MLTAKQEKFCQSIVDGLGQSEAYKLAYDCENSSPSTIYVNAYQLANDTHITTRLAELRAPVAVALAEERVFTALGLAREAETNLRLAREAEQYGPANRAIELIAKLTGNLEPAPTADVHITKVTIVLPAKIVDVSEYEVGESTETEIEGP